MWFQSRKSFPAIRTDQNGENSNDDVSETLVKVPDTTKWVQVTQSQYSDISEVDSNENNAEIRSSSSASIGFGVGGLFVFIFIALSAYLWKKYKKNKQGAQQNHDNDNNIGDLIEI